MAAAAAIVVLLTGTVYAARALLSPSEVARQTGEFSAAEAFSSKDSIMIGKTQTFGDYLLTLEGITSGKALGKPHAVHFIDVFILHIHDLVSFQTRGSFFKHVPEQRPRPREPRAYGSLRQP